MSGLLLCWCICSCRSAPPPCSLSVLRVCNMVVVVCESAQLLGIYHMKSMLKHCAAFTIDVQVSRTMYVCIYGCIQHSRSAHMLMDQTRSVPFTRQITSGLVFISRWALLNSSGSATMISLFISILISSLLNAVFVPSNQTRDWSKYAPAIYHLYEQDPNGWKAFRCFEANTWWSYTVYQRTAEIIHWLLI